MSNLGPTPEPVPELADTEPDQLPEPRYCSFCEWDKGLPGDYHPAGRMRPASLVSEPVWLCRFCYSTYAPGSWMAGGDRQREPEAMDIAIMFNILLTEIRKLAR